MMHFLFHIGYVPVFEIIMGSTEKIGKTSFFIVIIHILVILVQFLDI
jgi:hypothetical protein